MPYHKKHNKPAPEWGIDEFVFRQETISVEEELKQMPSHVKVVHIRRHIPPEDYPLLQKAFEGRFILAAKGRFDLPPPFSVMYI